MRRGPRAAARSTDRWESRPVLADLLRGALLAVPLVSSVVVVYAVGALVPMDEQRSWWALTMVLVAAVVTAVVTERIIQRLLPLTVLLQLTMLFPDRAPSRFRLARAAVVGPPTELFWQGAGATPTTTSDTVRALMSALGAHDRRTRGHSERVRILCDVLAGELKLDRAARDRLRWAALLHDVGKMAVAPTVLNKPAALDRAEFDAVKEHPAMGSSISGPLLPWLGEWGRGILEHHERYDGSGYPSGLTADQISAAGRIIALVDSFETMTAARAYKKPMATKAAREELARCAGTQFDPVYVRAFLAVSLPRMMWALGPVAFVVHAPFLRSLAEAGARSSAATGQAAASAAGVAVLATAGVGALATATAEPPTAAAAPPATAELAPSSPGAEASQGPHASSPESPPASSPTDLGSAPGAISTPLSPGAPSGSDPAVGAAGDRSAEAAGSTLGTGSTRATGPAQSGSAQTPRTGDSPEAATATAPERRDTRTEPERPDTRTPPEPREIRTTPEPREIRTRPGPRSTPGPRTAPSPRPDPTPTSKPPVVPTTVPTLKPPGLPPLPVVIPTLPPLAPGDRRVTFLHVPDARTTAHDATFALGTADGLQLQCRDSTDGRGLGGPEAGWSPCGRQVSFSGLAPGHYSFQARSVDDTGRKGAVSTHTWRVVDGAVRGGGLRDVVERVSPR